MIHRKSSYGKHAYRNIKGQIYVCKGYATTCLHPTLQTVRLQTWCKHNLTSTQQYKSHFYKSVSSQAHYEYLQK
jgi:hypothetical protein